MASKPPLLVPLGLRWLRIELSLSVAIILSVLIAMII